VRIDGLVSEDHSSHRVTRANFNPAGWCTISKLAVTTAARCRLAAHVAFQRGFAVLCISAVMVPMADLET